MPTITATVSSTSITLNNGAPYRILSATGMGAADVRRVTTQGPAQDGDTDQGYRLAPREIELVIGFQATTDTILDGYRDTLTSFFKPLSATPVKLRITRDDGEIRQIDCNVVGSIKIDLLPEHRPGHYHRCTVRLRAADPSWYKLAPGTVTYSGTALATNWWLAGGVIGTAQVLMHGGTPALNETWSAVGTPNMTWTLAVKAAFVTPTGGTEAYLYANPDLSADFGKLGTSAYAGVYNGNYVKELYVLDGSAMSAGTQVYFAGYGTIEPANPLFSTTYWINTVTGRKYYSGNASTLGTPKWRTLGWSGAIPLYALYTPALAESQRNALAAYMNFAAGSAGQSLALAYAGNLPEYPIISLTGPITSPTITNTATGDTIDFGTAVIGAGTTYVIDTRYGYKTVTAGTVNKVDQVTDDSDLATWNLVPSPVATGGTNIITVEGTGVGTATTIKIVYYDRYSSF